MMSLPADQYLLDEADEKILEAFVANGGKRGGPDWKAVCEVTLRLSKLLDDEGFATGKALGITPKYEGRGITDAQAWLTLVPPRRDYAFAHALVVMSEGEGLAQSSHDNPEWLAPGAEAFKAIAPEPIATDLYDYYEYYHRYMSLIEPYTLVWPEFDSLPGYDRLKPGLEKRMLETNWDLYLLQHVMRHRACFFRTRPGPG
jgi:hypothetical protein